MRCAIAPLALDLALFAVRRIVEPRRFLTRAWHKPAVSYTVRIPLVVHRGGVAVAEMSAPNQKPGSEPFPSWAEGHVFEQYRLIVEETARVSERRHSTNNLFVSVNSILLGAIAILVQQSTNRNVVILLFLVFLLGGAGFVLCLFWLMLLRGYSRRINKRLAYLGELETKRYATYLLPVFSVQDTQVTFARAEAGIPIIFIVTYLAAAAGISALGPGWLGALPTLLPH